MDAGKIWYSTRWKHKVLRFALFPLSLLYGLGWGVYRTTYKFGLKKPSYPHSAVLCVGGLVSGGAGKTPIVLAIAKYLVSQGVQVVLGCSGYGSPRSEAATLAPDGPLDPAEWGDEPSLMRMQLPDVPIIVGRRRVLAAEICSTHFPYALLLMDDGFQHLPLGKNLTIVVDPVHPKNKLLFPAGPYREPRSSAKNASLVLRDDGTYYHRSSTLESGAAIVQRGQFVKVLTGIGKPDEFCAQLIRMGFVLDEVVALQDHDPMTKKDLIPKGWAEMPIAVTLKDWVKLSKRQDFSDHNWILIQDKVTLTDSFKSWLLEQVHALTLR